MSGTAPRHPRLSPRIRLWGQVLAGLAILAALALHVGAEAFLVGIASITLPAVVAAAGLGAIATIAAAWRWRIVARRLGLALGWRRAVAAYYRSQFLNSVLPGGVVGDVHRALWHGRDGDRAHAARAVVAERAAGQAVQVVLLVALVLSLPGWIDTSAIGIVLLIVGVVAAIGVGAAVASRRVRAAASREARHLRVMFGHPGAALGAALASLVVVACHVATFLVACAAVGVAATPQTLVAVSLVAVLAAGIPLGVGGWGPREAAAAWAFTAAGLDAAAGVAASTAFGVLALLSVAPGALVIVVGAVRGRRRSATNADLAPGGAVTR